MITPSEVLTAEALKACGMTEAPKVRYEDMPEAPRPLETGQLVGWAKAKMLIDPLLTAKFARFITPKMIVDQAIDTASFKPDWCVCVTCRTDVPPPVNPLITRVTGVKAIKTEENFMRWLALEIENYANVVGSFRIGPPQVWRTHSRKPMKRIFPLMGVMVKYDRTPKDGLTMHDGEARLGILRPNIVKDEEEMIDQLVEEAKSRIILPNS